MEETMQEGWLHKLWDTSHGLSVGFIDTEEQIGLCYWIECLVASIPKSGELHQALLALLALPRTTAISNFSGWSMTGN